MAGVKLSGMEELKRNTRQIADVVLVEALDAAQDAAAQVVRDAIEAAAPVSKPKENLKSLPRHPSGNLRAHIVIVRAKPKGLTTTGPQNAVPASPDRPQQERGVLRLFSGRGLDLEQRPSKAASLSEQARRNDPQPKREDRGKPSDRAAQMVSQTIII